MSDTSSTSSDDSFEEEEMQNQLLNVLFNLEGQRRKIKNTNYVEVIVPLYSENDYIEHFRISREKIIDLSTNFAQSEYFPRKDTGFDRLTPIKHILVFLWFAGHEAASYRDVSDRFDIGLATLNRIINRVISYLNSIAASIIKWPDNEELKQIEADFRQSGFPFAIGAIDGTHVKIDRPADDPDSYLNCNKYYSIQVQAVCDSKKKFRHVFLGYPGSVHDARVFKNSPLFPGIEAKCGEYCIIGDSAYPCLRNLITPYKDMGNLNAGKINFNKKLSTSRIIIEHAFGLLKQKFRQLYHFKLRKVDTICNFIMACCVLHNIVKDVDINVVENANEEIMEDAMVDNERDEEYEGTIAGKRYRDYLCTVLNNR